VTNIAERRCLQQKDVTYRYKRSASAISASTKSLSASGETRRLTWT
jgi:hypothetical protein